MGQNNRQRRAAKQRKRATNRPRASATSATPSAADLIAFALRQAVRMRAFGTPAADCVHAQLADIWRVSPSAVERAADAMAIDTADALFHAGWAPVDLHETARRQLDTAACSYLLDTVAAATGVYPVQRVDPRWLAELAGIGATVWWDQKRPLLTQWAGANGMTGLSAMAIVLDVLALMTSLVSLEPTLPPPGSAMSSSSGPADAAEDRMLAKVRALLAKAESTEFDEEAEALSAKAQELMSRYAIDHAMLSRPAVGQRATLRRMWLAAPYVRAKSTLVAAVADANRCRTVLAEQAGYVTIVGDEGDARLVSLLATSLLVQASRALATTGPQFSRGGVSRTRSFRQSFLVAYAGRIGERLRETSDAVQADADQSRLLPVLAARTRAVDDALHVHFPHLVSKEITVGNAAGWGAGRAAADLALFDVAAAVAPPRERAG